MKTLVAPLLVAGLIGIGAALGQTPIARAGTYPVEPTWVGDLGTYPAESSGYDHAGTWPGGGGQTNEEFVNSDTATEE